MNEPKLTKYWTAEVDCATKQWMQTQNPDLWIYQIEPKLREMASYRIKLYPAWRFFNMDFEELQESLIKHCYFHLYSYDATKSSLPYYIQYIMLNRLHTLSKFHGGQCRDSKLTTSLYDYTHNCDGEEIIEIPILTEDYCLYKDPVFIQFYCDWWKKNYDIVFAYLDKNTYQCRRRFIWLVIAILEHPDIVPDEIIPTSYISRRLAMSRQSVSIQLQRIRPFNKVILREFNKEQLSALLLK